MNADCNAEAKSVMIRESFKSYYSLTTSGKGHLSFKNSHGTNNREGIPQVDDCRKKDIKKF
jgi:hypothetical protein